MGEVGFIFSRPERFGLLLVGDHALPALDLHRLDEQISEAMAASLVDHYEIWGSEDRYDLSRFPVRIHYFGTRDQTARSYAFSVGSFGRVEDFTIANLETMHRYQVIRVYDEAIG